MFNDLYSTNTERYCTVLYCTVRGIPCELGYAATESMDELLYSSRNASIRTPPPFQILEGFVDKFKQKYYLVYRLSRCFNW